jgi:hypothetical protein
VSQNKPRYHRFKQTTNKKLKVHEKLMSLKGRKHKHDAIAKVKLKPESIDVVVKNVKENI